MITVLPFWPSNPFYLNYFLNIIVKVFLDIYLKNIVYVNVVRNYVAMLGEIDLKTEIDDYSYNLTSVLSEQSLFLKADI